MGIPSLAKFTTFRSGAAACFLFLLLLLPQIDAFAQDDLMLSVSQSIETGDYYVPGRIVRVHIRIEASGAGRLTALGFTETPPHKWTFEGLAEAKAATAPNIIPTLGKVSPFDFAWISESDGTLPDLPVEFTFNMRAAAEQQGNAQVRAQAVYRYVHTDGSASGEERSTEEKVTLQPVPSPQQWYVSQLNPGDAPDGTQAQPFAQINTALTRVMWNRGDTVYVAPGTYEEQLLVPEGTTLLASGNPHNTFINYSGGKAAGDSFAVKLLDGATLRRFAITGGAQGAAVVLDGALQATCSNLIVYHSGHGIFCQNGATIAATNNTLFRNNDAGIYLSNDSLAETMLNNIFYDNAIGLRAHEMALEDYQYNNYHINEVHLDNAPHDDTDMFHDPGFVEPEKFNLYLRLDSPARNAGHPDAIHNDPDGSQNDLGADGGPYAFHDQEPPQLHLILSPPAHAVLRNQEVRFDASESSDDWGIAQCLWDFSGGNEFRPQAEGLVVDHSFADLGSHTVTVRIWDNSGLQTEERIAITVHDEALVLLAPHGGEEWPHHASTTIRWNDVDAVNTGAVRLSLYRGYSLQEVIGESDALTGSFLWTIPDSLSPAEDYTIQIARSDDPEVTAMSLPFSIVSEENQGLEGAQRIPFDGNPIQGRIDYTGEEDWFSFCLMPSQSRTPLLFRLTDPDRLFRLDLLAEDGETLIATADYDATPPGQLRLEWTPNTTGCFFLRISALHDDLLHPDNAYTLTPEYAHSGLSNGRLFGSMRDALTGAPVSGATVCLSGVETCSLPTGSDYALEAIPEGSYTLRAMADGYSEIILELSLRWAEEKAAPLSFEALAPPQAPQLNASNGTHLDHVLLEWNSVPHASAYLLYRDGVEFAEVDAVSWKDTTVQPGEAPAYQVKARYTGGLGPLSNTATGAVGDLVPPPQNLSASDGDFTDKILIQWDPVPGASHYQVYRYAADTPEEAQDHFDEALPVGEATTETSLEDSFEDVFSPLGCYRDIVAQGVWQYCVVAHTATLSSEPSTWDGGYLADQAACGLGPCNAATTGPTRKQGDAFLLILLFSLFALSAFSMHRDFRKSF